MKRINDTYIGLTVTATGVAFLALVMAGTKTQRQIESNADHPLDRQSVVAALDRVRATSGVHPLAERLSPPASQLAELPKNETNAAGGIDPAAHMLPCGHLPVVSMAEPNLQVVGKGSFSRLLRVQDKLRKAMEAIDKARSDLRMAVAVQSQPVP